MQDIQGKVASFSQFNSVKVKKALRKSQAQFLEKFRLGQKIVSFYKQSFQYYLKLVADHK